MVFYVHKRGKQPVSIEDYILYKSVDRVSTRLVDIEGESKPVLRYTLHMRNGETATYLSNEWVLLQKCLVPYGTAQLLAQMMKEGFGDG